MTRYSVAEAQRQLTDLVEKVAKGGEAILLVDRRRAIAKLIPAGQEEQVGYLASVQGWLEDDDPFFSAIDEIIEARQQHILASSLKEEFLVTTSWIRRPPQEAMRIT